MTDLLARGCICGICRLYIDCYFGNVSCEFEWTRIVGDCGTQIATDVGTLISREDDCFGLVDSTLCNTLTVYSNCAGATFASTAAIVCKIKANRRRTG